MKDRPGFVLDANCCNARQQVPELNELEELRDARRIVLVYAESSREEAMHGNSPRDKKVDQFSWLEINENGHNQEVWASIEVILFPDGAKDKNQLCDVRAVYHAERLCWPLITMDGASKSQPKGILGNATGLLEIGVEVISPAEALRRIKEV